MWNGAPFDSDLAVSRLAHHPLYNVEVVALLRGPAGDETSAVATLSLRNTSCSSFSLLHGPYFMGHKSLSDPCILTTSRHRRGHAGRDEPWATNVKPTYATSGQSSSLARLQNQKSASEHRETQLTSLDGG